MRCSLSVMKTTQSGWANFLRDNYTTLPETTERILATTLDVKWTYTRTKLSELLRLDFDGIHRQIRDAALGQFFGPPKTGIYSKGVQETLFKMASAAIETVKEIDTVTFSLPNLHFLPCSLPVYQQNGILFEDDVFIPSDEPHGLITATVSRWKTARPPSTSSLRRSRL